MNPTALFLSYLTVIKLVDLGFSSVMIFSSLVPIYQDHHIVLVLEESHTIFTSQEVYIMAQVNGPETRMLSAMFTSLITPNSSAMIVPCHHPIFRHKFSLIIKPYTHLVHLVIELCINFVYSIKN